MIQWRPFKRPLRLAHVLLGVIGKALALSAVVTCIGLFFLAEFQEQRQQHELERALSLNVAHHLELLIPTYLLADQEPARAMILEHMRTRESLSHASILPAHAAHLPNMPSCKTHPNTMQTCYDASSQQLILIAPIIESDITYGYLIKKRMQESLLSEQYFLEIAGLIAIVLLLTFAISALLFSRFIKRDVRGGIRTLLDWAQSRLQEQGSSEVPAMPATELSELGHAIGELIEGNRALQARMAFAETAALVAHDIQSPLSSMKSALRYLQQLAVEAPHYEDYLNLLQLSATRLHGIAENLLCQRDAQLARDDTLFSVHHVLDSLVGEYSCRTDCQQISFEKDYADTDLRLQGNPTALQRALGNLVRNALEAMQGQEGTIRFTTRQEHNAVRLSIQDTGCGMSAGLLANILYGTPTQDNESAGMGIAVVREILKEFGGQLEGKSTVNVGSSFTLIVPLPAEELLRAAPAEVCIPVPADRRLMVIDDEPSMREQWRLLLQEEQITPYAYQHLEELQAAERETVLPNVAIVDYHFDNSEHNGIDVVRWLKEYGTQHITLCTAEYWKPHIQHLAEDLGVSLCPKPLPTIRFTTEATEQRPTEPAARSQQATSTNTETPQATATDDDDTTDAPPTRVLVIDDDDGVRLGWSIEKYRLGIEHVQSFASMEDCEAAAPDYPSYDYAFIDKNIPESSWGLGDVILHLKNAGIRRVVVASGEAIADLQADPECQQADVISPEKIPEQLP